MTFLSTLRHTAHTRCFAWPALAAAVLSAGCASMSPPPPVDVLPTAPPPLAATAPRMPPPVTGGLFHTASYRPSFEDRRARLVGDNVTIQIVENVTASQKSSSTVDRTSKISGGVTALPFTGQKFTDKLGVGANSENAFEGKGGTELDVAELERLPVRQPEVDEDHVHGEVAQVDHFGNLTLNVQAADLEAAGMHLGDDVELRVGGKTLRAPFRLTYGEVARGRLAVCEDAFRTITIAVNQGSAATTLRARRADPFVLARVTAPASVLVPGGPA